MTLRRIDSRRPPGVGKRRTRAHVLADLSVNYVERQALLCGYSVERVTHDYGTDLLLFTYDRRGVIENGHVLLQLKATDSPQPAADGSAIRVVVDRRDLLHWLNEPWPVILVVYDGHADRAYWIHVQAYFAAASPATSRERTQRGRQVTVHLPMANVVDPAAMRAFARSRDAVLAQIRESIRHDA